MTRLSDDLLPIYELEIDNGNEVVRIDEPAGTNCPYAVKFTQPLHCEMIKANLALADSVEYWECRDGHYEIEAGYFSNASHHVIAGPLGSD